MIIDKKVRHDVSMRSPQKHFTATHFVLITFIHSIIAHHTHVFRFSFLQATLQILGKFFVVLFLFFYTASEISQNQNVFLFSFSHEHFFITFARTLLTPEITVISSFHFLQLNPALNLSVFGLFRTSARRKKIA